MNSLSLRLTMTLIVAFFGLGLAVLAHAADVTSGLQQVKESSYGKDPIDCPNVAIVDCRPGTTPTKKLTGNGCYITQCVKKDAIDCPNVAIVDCQPGTTPTKKLTDKGCYITQCVKKEPIDCPNVAIVDCRPGTTPTKKLTDKGCYITQCIKKDPTACPNVANQERPTCLNDVAPVPVITSSGCISGYRCPGPVKPKGGWTFR